MITLEEVKEKYMNSKNISLFNKTLFKLFITKIGGFNVCSFKPNNIQVKMKFIYWNPLTYIHLLIMLILNLPRFIFDGGFNEMYNIAKTELFDGFTDFI